MQNPFEKHRSGATRIPTIHSVPREAVAPFLAADLLVAVDVARLREALRTALRLHDLLHELLQVLVFGLVEHAVPVAVHVLELPLENEPVELAPLLARLRVDPRPLLVEDVDEVVVKQGLVGALAPPLRSPVPSGGAAFRRRFRCGNERRMCNEEHGVEERGGLPSRLHFDLPLRDLLTMLLWMCLPWGSTHQQEPVTRAHCTGA